MKKAKQTGRLVHSAKLKNYSALSASFIALAAPVTSQVVYTDVNPDINVFLDEITLDLDNNGTNDFKLVFVSETFATFAPEELKLRINPLGENKVAYSFQTIPVTYSGTPWYTYNSGATQIVFSNVPLLNESAAIDEAMDFSLDKAALFEKLYFYIYSSYDLQAFEGGWWNGTENHFAAFQLDIDGTYHFGWMRLNVSVETGITLLDYAFESIPDSPITTAINNYHISWINVEDAGITATPEDLAFSFNAAGDEEDLDAYRVICAKAGTPISVADANSLPTDRYVSITPDGSDSYNGNFATILLDSDGDLISTNQEYQLWVLHELNAATNYLNTLSIPSNTVQLVDTVGIVTEFSITDIDNNGNAADIRIDFDAPAVEQGIVAYKIFIAQKDAADIFTLADALVLSAERYIEVLPGDASYSIIPTPTLLNTEGNVIEPDKYKVFVVSIPDGTTVAHAAMTLASNVISLEQPTSVVENILLEDVADEGNGADIKVTYFIPAYEQTIETYRIFFVDFATAFDFDLSSALASSNYIEITPTGSDITVTGDATTKDSNGNLITWGVPYYAYVLALASDYGIDDTLSLPSNQVILNYPVVIGVQDEVQQTPQIFAQSNQVFIQLTNDNPATVNIYNSVGQIVFNRIISSSEKLIVDLPAGNYFVSITQLESIYTRQVFVTE